MKTYAILLSLALATGPITAAEKEFYPDKVTVIGCATEGKPQATFYTEDIQNITVLVSNPNESTVTFPGGSVTVHDKFDMKNFSFDFLEVSAPIHYENYSASPLHLHFEYRDADRLSSPRLFLSSVEEGWRNSFRLGWSAVSGASEYEVVVKQLVYDQEIEVLRTRTADTSLDVVGLEYSSQYSPSVRALHPSGDEAKHSDYSSRIFMYENGLVWSTNARYETPEILSVIGRTQDSFTLDINLQCSDKELYGPNFVLDAQDRYVVETLRVVPLAKSDGTLPAIDAKYSSLPLTADMINPEGHIIITVSGLESMASYRVDVLNTAGGTRCEADARFNTVKAVTSADPSVPILLEGADTNLSNFFDNLNAGMYQEGQIIHLKGGETYTIYGQYVIPSGFIMRTDPADVAMGKRATVVMEVPTAGSMIIGNSNVVNEMETIGFHDIDFVANGANNFGVGAASGTGNYFLNNRLGHNGVTVDKIELNNCTFKGFIRGFVRIQGDKPVVYKHLWVKDCLIYDCGYYDNNGRGYAWFAGCGLEGSNIFGDFQFTGNTIYDSPRTSLLNDNNKNIEYTDIAWNIKVENNTFVNFSTRTNGNFMFNLRYLPAATNFSCQRNLFVLAADDADQRPLNNQAADVRQINGNDMSNLHIAIKDNYSVGCREEHHLNDGIFTGGYSFSRSGNSFGNAIFASYLDYSADDLVVKPVTDDQGEVMKATDLFNSPNAPYSAYDSTIPNALDHAAPDNIMEALKYKVTPAIITEKNIGDPRWRN